MVVAGKRIKVFLIQNPTIDDVLLTEAQLWAYYVETADPLIPDRRVSRGIRNFLIQLGV